MTEIREAHVQPSWARGAVMSENPLPFSSVASAPLNFMQAIQQGSDTERQALSGMYPFDSITNGPCPNYVTRDCAPAKCSCEVRVCGDQCADVCHTKPFGAQDLATQLDATATRSSGSSKPYRQWTSSSGSGNSKGEETAISAEGGDEEEDEHRDHERDESRYEQSWGWGRGRGWGGRPSRRWYDYEDDSWFWSPRGRRGPWYDGGYRPDYRPGMQLSNWLTSEKIIIGLAFIFIILLVVILLARK